LRTLLFIGFAARSVFVVLREPFDLAFATSTPLTAAIPGIVAKLIRRKIFVFEVRDLWPELPRAMGVIRNPLVLLLMDGLERAAYRMADGCIGLAPGIVDGIRKRAPDGKKLALISNGAEPVPARCDSVAIDGISAGDFVAVFAGAHGLANGLDAVLDVAAILERRGDSRIKVLFIGDGMCKRALVERARSEGLSNCLFHDSLPREELAAVYSRADVGLMVLANVAEFSHGTSPNKFFDYLAHGLPVINNYPGWVADLIVEWSCGLVVEPGQPEAFANALHSLADDPLRARSMGAQARNLLAEKFDSGKLADQFVQFLEETARC
jgi:glycosyltransferase involved in cell wall biosynthesis